MKAVSSSGDRLSHLKGQQVIQDITNIGEDEKHMREMAYLVAQMMQHKSEPPSELPIKQAQTYITLGQSILGLIFGLCAIFGFFWTYNGALHTEIQALADRATKGEYLMQANATSTTTNTARLDRNDSNWNDVSTRMARMEVLLQQISTKGAK
jgi:hypothetical protein